MMDASLPRVTICVPCYNSEKTIVETLDSIIRQDYSNFRVLVCDNSSKDRTAEIVKGYASRNVDYLLNPVVRTAEDNWNFLLKNIPTEHFCIYHADDLYDPSIVSRQVSLFLQGNASAVFTMSTLINDHGKPLAARVPTETAIPKQLGTGPLFEFKDIFNGILQFSNFIRTPTLFTSKAVIAAVGDFRYSMFRSSSDLDLWLRMARLKPLGIISDQLHHYRVSMNQSSFHIYNNRVEPQDYFTVIDHYLADPNVARDVDTRSLNYYNMYKGAEYIVCAINLFSARRAPEGRKMLRLAFKAKNASFAIRNKKTFAKYLFGAALLTGSYVGAGTWLANFFRNMQARKAEQWSQ